MSFQDLDRTRIMPVYVDGEGSPMQRDLDVTQGLGDQALRGTPQPPRIGREVDDTMEMTYSWPDNREDVTQMLPLVRPRRHAPEHRRH